MPDHFDDIAAMFLTDDAADDDAVRDTHHDEDDSMMAADSAATIELIVVGHLPVRAGLWLLPFAASVQAVDQATTCLLRLDSMAPGVHMLGGPDVAHADLLPLQDAIMQLAPHTGHWLIRPDETADPEALAAAGADRITILTGGDQVAVVRSYETIKAILHHAQRAQCDEPDIAVAVLGAETARAHTIADQIDRVTRRRLGARVSLRLALPQIPALDSAGARALRCIDKSMPELSDVLRWIDESSLGSAQVSSSTLPPVAPPRPPLRVEEDEEDVEYIEIDNFFADEDDVAPTPERAPVAEPLLRDVAGGGTDSPRTRTVAFSAARSEPRQRDTVSAAPPQREVKLPPKPRQHATVEAKSPDAPPREPITTDGRPQLLSAYVPELTALPFRPPDHEHLEIAVDTTSGRLHLLGRESALRDLHVAQRWLRTHAELLSMALASMSITITPEVIRADRIFKTVHIFTDTPRAIADLHGSDLKLHLLTPVEVDGRVGWYHAEMN